MNGIGLKELGELRSMIKDSKKKTIQAQNQSQNLNSNPIGENGLSVVQVKSDKVDPASDGVGISEKQSELLFEFRRVSRGRPKKEDEDKSQKTTIYLNPESRRFLKKFNPDKQISKKINLMIGDYQRVSEWQARMIARFETYSKKLDVVMDKMDIVSTFDKKLTDQFSEGIFAVSKEIRSYMSICSINIVDIEKYLTPKALENIKFALSYSRTKS